MRFSPLLVLALLLHACGGSSSDPEALAASSSEGGEVEADRELPLEAYVSPELDYLFVDLEGLRRSPIVGRFVEELLAELSRNAGPNDAGFAEAVGRASKALFMITADALVSPDAAPRGFLLLRGDYAGFSPESLGAADVTRRGDHTLVIRRGGALESVGTAHEERFDAALSARIAVGPNLRAQLPGPAQGVAAGVEHVRVRVRVGSTIDIDVRLDHAEAKAARDSLDQLSSLLAQVQPLLLFTPPPILRLAQKLMLGQDGASVVVRLELDARDLEELAALAKKADDDEALAEADDSL